MSPNGNAPPTACATAEPSRLEVEGRRLPLGSGGFVLSSPKCALLRTSPGLAAIELNPRPLRPNCTAATPRPVIGGNQSVKTVRPNTTEPIPVRATPPKMGTIIVRFVGLLFVAVALMAL